MSMVKVFLKVLKKHKTLLAIYMVIFAIIMAISSSNTSGVGSDENSYFKLGIVDRSGNGQSELVGFLKDNFRTYEVKDDINLMKDAIISYYYDYILVIEPDGQLVSYAREDSMSKSIIDMRINEYVNTKSAVDSLGLNLEPIEINRLLSEKVEVEYSSGKDIDKSLGRMIYNYFATSTYTIMIMISISISTAYRNFGKQNMIRRLSVSATSMGELNRKLFMALIAILFIFWLLLSVIALVMFRSNILNTMGYTLMANMFIFMIPIAAMGFLIMSLAKTISAQNAMANAISLILSFISGVFVSREFLPEIVIKISTLAPPYWYISAIKEAISGGNMNNILKYYAVMLIMTVAFVALKSIIDNRKFGEGN